MPIALDLRFHQVFGARLINPAAAFGLTARRPHVMHCTGLGVEAYGSKNVPTLFTQSLLQALRGLAASPNDNRAIDTHWLGYTTTRLLGLHFRDGEPLQHFESQLSTPFVVSVEAPTDTATTKPTPFIVRQGRSQVADEKRIALVIGNAAYEAATMLANPENDALRMADALERLGFEVVCRHDCDINEFDKRLREFTRKLEGADVGLLYYSGHALQLHGENYLIPVDVRLEEPDDLERRAFKVSTYLVEMRSAAQVSIVFLDACRDNPFALNSAGRIAKTKNVLVRRPGLKEIDKTDLKGALIAFAAEEGHTAADGEKDGLSPFTQALLDQIETPGLELSDMMRRVKRSVLEQRKEGKHLGPMIL